MKRIIIIALILLLALTSCSANDNNNLPSEEVSPPPSIEETDLPSDDDAPWVLRRMLMYENRLYFYIDDKLGEPEGDTVFDGSIESEVAETKKPFKNNQSNFGKGYDFIVNEEEKTIEVYLGDGKWWLLSRDIKVP